MSGGLHTVHVRVNDAATGRPTPVRIRFTGPDGTYYAPLGRLADFPTGRGEDVGGHLLLGDERYAYIDGACEIRLPAGPVTVEVTKGFEYVPLRRDIVLAPGRLAVRLAVERWADPRRDGWISGDTHALFLTPHAALLEAAAEDVAVANVLAADVAEPRHALPGILAFSGQRPALQAPGHLVVVNTLNTHPVLGRLGLLNCHRVVYPLRFGAPDGLDDWTLADWCDQCHRKGGLVVWADAPPRGSDRPLGEPLADLLLGKVDAFEVTRLGEQGALDRWYTLLAAGLRVPLVGGSGKDRNAVALGGVRTYARLQPGEELAYASWIEAVRAGRTFVTNGPLLQLDVDGHAPGETVRLGAAGMVRVRAEARSIVAFDRLEVVLNGAVVAEATPSDGVPCAAAAEAEVPAPTGGWLAARCRGSGRPLAGGPSDHIAAHTSAVDLQIEGRPTPVDAAAVADLAAELDRMLDWVRHEARCETDRQPAQLQEVFQTARAVLVEQARKEQAGTS